MSNQEVKVSILCLAFNHEKYIRETLESFVSQKCDFRYEVLVHDDASTDSTAEIISEYAEKYPDIIRPVLQKENQHSQRIPIWKTHVVPLIRGKYVAMCEGDDYWTDPLKLQKQYDILEKNPDCSMCVHKVNDVNEDGTPTELFRPAKDLAEGKIDTAGFLKIQTKYPFQTTSFFMRADIWIEYINNPPQFRLVADVGDEPMLLNMVAKGNIYYLPECMSAYRKFSIGSWSAKTKKNSEKHLIHTRKMYEMMSAYNEYTGNKYDCNLAIYRCRVLWLEKDFKQLVKKENAEGMKEFSKGKRMYIRICAVLPFVHKIRTKIRTLIKGVKNGA
ncbi:MAG: glycosyltransferase family 2 protein [Ruminococcus sp.]|nr:glycosyltransferase family 2 protein [Ruminococcus sp.]